MSFHSTVYGKYFLLDRIAVGGMAEVFKAKTFGVRGFERLLVIKRILPHLSKDEEFVEMFIDEAKTAVELSHANICQVSDLGKIGDNYFIAMEYIDGKDLRGILKKCHTARTAITVPQAVYVQLETLKGLDYAHRKSDSLSGKPLNVIHRDISPQNIMISYEGEVKIVDFGIAKTESKLSKTQAGVLKGKFGYMSPEQAAGLELDLRTDLFSSGIVFWETLTGRRLFLGENDFDTLERIKDCKIPPPSKYNPSVLPALEAVVLRALAKEREDRFSSAQEMHSALSRIFYTQYPDFTPQEISSFLRNIFATEIDQEQESLRRAIDALPEDELRAATSAAEAANDRLIESGSQNRSGSGKRPIGADLLAPSPPSRWNSRSLRTAAVLTASACIGAWFTMKLWAWLAPAGAPPPTPTPSAQTHPEMRQVEILSDPPGASLEIDGRPAGKTPIGVRLTPRNWYTLRLEKPGMVPWTDRVLITEDQDSYGPYRLAAHLPSKGVLHVSSVPAGAQISINQTRTELRTPATLPDITLNETHVVRLELAGYRAVSKKITLQAAEKELPFVLVPNRVTLRIHATPENASVFIDGKERGQQVDDLEAGRAYRLRVEAPGYAPIERSLTLSDPKEDLVISLKRKEGTGGTISFNANPWAEVLVDGKKIPGGTPAIDIQLSEGEHTVVFRHPDFKPVQRKIRIKRGANPPVIVDLRSP